MDDLSFFQGKSLQRLGDSDKANQLFNALITKGNELRKSGTENTLIAVEEASIGNKKQVSMAYYLEGLGHLGHGDKEKANLLFAKAIEEYDNNLWARRMAAPL